MNKTWLIAGIVFLILALGGAAYALSQYYTGEGDRAGIADLTGAAITLTGDKTPITEGTFEFQGFAVGKSHIGTFTDWNGYGVYKNGKLTGAAFEINADSVATGITRLDTHLLSDDFFDTATFPTILFQSNTITLTGTSGEVVGALTFRGVTKEITFPLDISGGRAKADFYLDTTPFAMKYAAVNKEVRIAFDFPLPNQ